MNLIIFSILAVFASIGLAYLFAKFVIKNFPEKGRKGAYVGVYVTFIILTILTVTFNIVRVTVNKTADFQLNILEEYITENHANSSFVRDGFDLVKAGENVTELNNVVTDIVRMLPAAADLGLPPFLYGMIVDSFRGRLQNRITELGYAVQEGSDFTDENGILTVSSLKFGLQKMITNIVNIIFFVIIGIFALILFINIIKWLLIANKEKKRIAKDTTPVESQSEPAPAS